MASYDPQPESQIHSDLVLWLLFAFPDSFAQQVEVKTAHTQEGNEGR